MDGDARGAPTADGGGRRRRPDGQTDGATDEHTDCHGTLSQIAMRGLFGRRLFPRSNILAAISDAAATGTAHGAVGQDDLIAALPTNRDAKLLLIPR